MREHRTSLTRAVWRGRSAASRAGSRSRRNSAGRLTFLVNRTGRPARAGLPREGLGGAGLVPGPWFLPPRGRSGLRGQGRPQAAAAGGAQAALTPEGRPRTLRGTPPGMSGGASRLLYPLRRSGSGVVQQLRHRFCRGLPAECLAGAAVEGGGDGGQIARAVAAQVGALGEVLAQQPVGVLVAGPLPGAVRVAEVDLDARVDAQLRVAGHLRALV